MIKALIIDDEKDARFVLRSLIEKVSEKIRIIGEADGIETGIEAIRKLNPDVVFLDVQMRTGTGFDLLAKLDEINFELVFVTAHNQYAVDAFKFSAFGYLLKPIRPRELSPIIEKLERHLIELKKTTNQRIQVLIENYGKNGDIEKLIIANADGFQVIKINDLIRLEGDRNYTHFMLIGNKRVTTSKNLGEYEELLENYGFFRIHQSTMISLRHVTGYQKADGGRVVMIDGKDFKVSRYRKNDFLKKFHDPG